MASMDDVDAKGEHSHDGTHSHDGVNRRRRHILSCLCLLSLAIFFISKSAGNFFSTGLIMRHNLLPVASLATVSLVNAAALVTSSASATSSQVPDYFQTSPEIYQGPTSTGAEPYLAETNPVTFSGATTTTFIPASPLQTAAPIQNEPAGGNIFTQMGNIGPYHASPGFGVDEYPLPEGAQVEWLNMLARHGSRYPTDPITLGSAIYNATNASFTGDLAWLSNWTYSLGTNILIPIGRQELYDSGVLHNYLYGHLFSPNATSTPSQLLLRTTTEDRMRKSAENFAAGFFGLDYGPYAKLEFIIDETGFNNSLAGYNVCPNNNNFRTTAGANVSLAWIEQYTANASQRFNAASTGFNWTSSYVYNAQQLCAYETIALGYSKWCDLFTWQEWLDFEYSIDLDFAGTYGFQSPTSRAVGVGYVEEVLAKINHHLITKATGSVNVTLDSMPSTFPLYQKLNFDFTHEVNLFSVLTAFGFTQFAPLLSTTSYQSNRSLIVSHMVPFGCRLDIELIQAPAPVNPNRPSSGSQYESGDATTYIHFVLNQRTLPLGQSISACGNRADGWCELSTWMQSQANALQEADYNYACYGNYSAPSFGQVSNGAPPSQNSTYSRARL